MVTRSPNMLAEGIVSERLLQGVLKEFRTGALSRMNRARDYYDGSHAIDKRTKPVGAPNNKVAASYPRYIVTLASGYLAGSPVQYAGGEQNAAALEAVQLAYDSANIESVDMELAQNASIYGVAVEIVYFDKNSRPRASSLDPRTAFVVYDDTVEHEPLFGVCWHETQDRADATSRLIREREAAALKEITRAYQHAAHEITGSIGSIFRSYQYRHNLTTDEAARALSEPPSQAEYKMMWARLNTLDPLSDEYMTLDQISSARAYAFRIRREAALLQTTRLELAGLAQIQFGATTEYLKQAFGISAQAVQEQLKSRLGLRIKLAKLTPTIMERVLKQQWSGMNYSERIWKSMDALHTTLKDVMTDGLLSGSSLDEMALEISDRMGVALSNARRLVRTESTYVNNQVALESYRQAGLDQYEYVTAKDERVCAVCGPLDGRRFKIEEAVIGENLPPIHPNCRCTTIAVVDAKANTRTAVKNPATDFTLTRLIEVGRAVDQAAMLTANSDVQNIGMLKESIYAADIQLLKDDIIITDERISHIEDGHSGEWEAYGQYIESVINEPDDVFYSVTKPNTLLAVKKILLGEKSVILRATIRIHTQADNPKYTNSVITYQKINEAEYRRISRSYPRFYPK